MGQVVEQSALLYKLKQEKVQKKWTNPTFVQLNKVNDKWEEGDPFRKFSGYLNKIEPRYNKVEDIYSLNFYFTSETGEKEILQLGYNQVTKGVLNTLAGEDDIDVLITLSVTSGENGYSQCYVNLPGKDKTNWKYGGKEMSDMEVEQVNGVIEKDITPRLNPNAGPTKSESDTVTVGEGLPAEPVTVDDDDLPF